ncbi:BREX-1 system phosphatase PglZ type A [Idiomarina sp.]|uniref:BREX-1 system phosphatase PglZ type A n=1 Tax=Idiomarina sp. TaxID=1874361 RepID=UPI003A8C9FE3
MQLEKLAEGIKKKFEQGRIVFWHDPERSFADDLPELTSELESDIANLRVVNLADVSVFATKKRMELDEPAQKFLLYSPEPAPTVVNDWLFDIRKYSPEFYADQSSILITELGLQRMSLRAHISQRKAFFASKKRISDLQKRLTGEENELQLDLRMMAVLTKAETNSLDSILFSLFEHYAEVVIAPEVDEDETEYDGKNDKRLPMLKQLARFDLDVPLFALLQKYYGYESDEPSIKQFVLRLFCTELYTQLSVADGDKTWLKHNVLKTPAGRATANALMSGWRDSKKHSKAYETIAHELQRLLELPRQLERYEPSVLLECETFEGIEQAIIRGSVRALLTEGERLERSDFEAALSRRLMAHWPQSKSEYSSIYQALRYGELLLHLRRTHNDGFHFDSAQAMYRAYEQDLYQFDQAYRLFNEHAHHVQSKGADILRELDDEVERIYSNWYLTQAGMTWDNLIEKEGLMEKWSVSGVHNQYGFFQQEVRGRLKDTQMKRMFVIVSDALRYEIAHELTNSINNEKRFKASLASQLGVLPSYTQLGMAALLPRAAAGSGLAYDERSGSTVVTVDGTSAQGLESRNKLLQRVNGMAVSFKEIMAWSNQQGRDAVRDAEVVYIYHDTIDAIGDKAATEERTFAACRDAISELKDLVGRVINRLNASRLVITADHGFLFRQQAMEEHEKTTLEIKKPDGAREAKKRYIVGENLPLADACWRGVLKDTTGGRSDTQFMLPKGMQRFHFVGGAKFVHGGASLQEVCVPVLEVRALDKKQAQKHERKPVDVMVVAAQQLKIVNNIDSIRFMQTDAVSERLNARQLNIYIRDSEGNMVSAIETVNFDSTGSKVDERTRNVMIKLKGSHFDRTKNYTLVLQNDDQARTEYNTYSVRIDLAIQDDFF